jgi:hypothetical protein
LLGLQGEGEPYLRNGPFSKMTMKVSWQHNITYADVRRGLRCHKNVKRPRHAVTVTFPEALCKSHFTFKDNKETTPLGVRLVVEGPLTLCDGVVAQIRSVWFIESGERAARLATAYPVRQRKRI